MFRVTACVVVEVTVNDPDVFERITGPNGDEWRASMYNLRTEGDVLEMFFHNAVQNGCTDLGPLDGWGDLPREAATFRVTDNYDHEYVELSTPQPKRKAKR
jgi:hypothetical protein